MKLLLFLALLLPTMAFAQPQAWPRNTKTNKIEFTGILPWPDSAKTLHQRQQLVFQWYFTKLTDLTRAEAAKHATVATQYNEKLTYAGLPQLVLIRHRAGMEHFQLLYRVELLPTSRGLIYHFVAFECGWASEDVSGGWALEDTSHLTTTASAAIALFRQRLATAQAGW
jgi:hypothetical protein